MESEQRPLTRREVYNIVMELENYDPSTPEDQLEDVTDLLFSALDCL
jgi:hypothetical protein